MSINEAFDNALDRYRKLRVGQLKGDIDSDGFVEVTWMDGDLGGQPRVQLSYPAYTNSSGSWGMELGYAKGMVCVFGFLTDNHAVILTTLISRSTSENAGYKKSNKIKSGEFRVTSKAQGSVYFDAQGNVIIANPKNSITLDNSGKKIDIVAPGVKIKIGTLGANEQQLIPGDTTPDKSSVVITVDGHIELTNGESSVKINDAGVQIETTSPRPVTVGGSNYVLYSITGQDPQTIYDIAVSNTLTVGGLTQAVPISSD